jgi:hypothetical protein
MWTDPQQRGRNMTKEGVVSIHGKEYKTVALRVFEFRQANPDWGISTEVVAVDDQSVVMKAWITDPDGRVRGCGHGEEWRAASKINSTSALENAETSAIGRALAAVGLAGTEYASADEVAGAIHNQKVQESIDYLLEHMSAARDNWQSVSAIKQAIEDKDLTYACQLYSELGHDAQSKLYKAPSKGGIFTTAERTYMRSDDWTATMKEVMKETANG